MLCIGVVYLSKEQLLEFEPQANKNSEPFVREFLDQFDVSNKDVTTILRLIDAADEHRSSQDDEEIMVDADQLSKLNINHMKEKYKPEAWMEMYTWFEDLFPRRVKTKKAKELLPGLLIDFKYKIVKDLEKV